MSALSSTHIFLLHSQKDMAFQWPHPLLGNLCGGVTWWPDLAKVFPLGLVLASELAPLDSFIFTLQRRLTIIPIILQRTVLKMTTEACEKVTIYMTFH